MRDSLSGEKNMLFLDLFGKQNKTTTTTIAITHFTMADERSQALNKLYGVLKRYRELDSEVRNSCVQIEYE